MPALLSKAANARLRLLLPLALACTAGGAPAPSPARSHLQPAAAAACTGFNFAAPRVFDIFSSARAVAVADMNKDGKADLLVANGTTLGRVTILFGDGSGGITSPVQVNVVRNPASVVTADFDKDGNLDFAASSGDPGSNLSSALSVRFGDGAGQFPRSKSLLTSFIPISYLSLMAGDFNLDGNPDLALANGANGVTVMLGNGDGDFPDVKGYAAGTGPVQVAVRDFNGDSKPDLATANVGSDNVSVLLGDGSGAFGAATNFAVSDDPRALVAGDFNGDGKFDLAAASPKARVVSVLLGNGDGTFAAANSIPTGGASPTSLASGDYDGDGDADIAVAAAQLGIVLVLAGDGAGGFSAAANFLTGGHEPVSLLTMGMNNALATVDFNNDGVDDLASANDFSRSVSVLLNSCASGPAPALVKFHEVRAVFNEAVGLAGNGTATVNVLRMGSLVGAGTVDYATADGTATAPADYAAMAGTLSFADGEVFKTLFVPIVDDNISEGDETVNLALSNPGGALSLGDPATATLFILANDGKPRVSISDLTVAEGHAGTTAAALTVSLSNPSSSTVTVSYATADATANAGEDYVSAGGTLTFAPGELSKSLTVTVNGDQSPEISETFSVLLTNPVNAEIEKAAGLVTITDDDSSCPAPSFGTPTHFDSGGTTPGHAVAADFNGDGKPDLAVGHFNGGGIAVRLGDGAGGFGTATNFPGGGGRAVVAADFNSDGKADLAATTGDSSFSKVNVLLGDGAGNFAALSPFDAGTFAYHLTAADLNGDAKPDLAVANLSSANVSVLLGDGAGGFATPVNYATGLSPKYVAAADFNGDGKTDLAVANMNSRTVSVLAGDGAGNFATPVNFAVNGGPQALAVSDFNGDGKNDLAVAVNNADGVAFLAGDGAGGFAPATYFPVSERPNHVAVADLNGDGRSDLIAANYGQDFTAGTVSVLFGNGRGNFSAPSNFAARNNPYASAAADFDKNGRPDLAVTNTRSNSVSILLNTCQTVAAPTVQFAATAAAVGEAAGHVTLTVTRSGDASSPASVDYQTSDADTFTVGCADSAGAAGNAFARCDFATSVGTLSFAAGETSRQVSVPVIDDGHDEGDETFQLRLSNATGASLGGASTATVTIQDNDGANAQNPVVSSVPFFVRQQYLDFLSREPDDAGFNAWSGVLDNCPNIHTGPEVQSGCDRIFVSGEGFFRSVEFQLKGAYVFRFYKAAFNRLPEYSEIVSDMSFVAGATPAEVFARRAELATRFTQRQEFTQKYGEMTNQQYVSDLLGRYGLTQVTTPDPQNPDAGQKVTLTNQQLVDRLNGAGGALTRAQILRAVADSDEVGAREFDNAFVAMQYYGYLRRKPEAAGFEAWLNVLRSGDTRTMVNGFLNSLEYKLRFGAGN
ncbi:MAG TPA: FG-GAP-like repeat-containing protein [Pyrinomonadaceae bacterium]|nr:FG-GAP-like repeat-containing protein [Pyrinomonadaceae bacterium]